MAFRISSCKKKLEKRVSFWIFTWWRVEMTGTEWFISRMYKKKIDKKKIKFDKYDKYGRLIN